MVKILIVDDDDELRSNISTVLDEKGYSTETASSGIEAIEMSSTGNYDIVLLDLMMPGMNGMDVLFTLKRNAPKTKVIIMTAFASIDNSVQAMKKGASDYIAKPFQVYDLDLTIKKILEEARFNIGIKDMDLDDTLAVLSNKTRRNILSLLALYGEMRSIQITKQLGIDGTKLSFHLKILRESGLISQHGKAYYISTEGKNVYESLIFLEANILK